MKTYAPASGANEQPSLASSADEPLASECLLVARFHRPPEPGLRAEHRRYLGRPRPRTSVMLDRSSSKPNSRRVGRGGVVRDVAHGTGLLATTYRVDGYALAFCGERMRPLPRPLRPQAQTELALRRKQLAGQIEAERNRGRDSEESGSSTPRPTATPNSSPSPSPSVSFRSRAETSQVPDALVVETGSHQELVAADGLYASLWRRQSGGLLCIDPDSRVEEAAE